MNQEGPHRPIKSFVLRQGRITVAQQRAFESYWPKFGLDYIGQVRNFDAEFGRPAETVLEIGFGNGEQLAFSAGNEPSRNFIGVEVHRPGVGRLLHTIAAQASDNVRVYHHDAVEVLQHEIGAGSLAEVRIYFPDPWHKKRHNKRRLIQPDLLELLADRVAQGGSLHLATDWADYAEHMSATLQASQLWENRAESGEFVARPLWRIETHFEKRGVRLGHGVWDLLYRRR
ncbi:MAG: tRNA (guanosine(46)-N7)-methyltransferase TrmB [Tahibacter sp.]